MGQLKKAFMQIMNDDMGGANPIDVELVENLMLTQYQNSNDFKISSDIYDIQSAITRLKAFKGDLKPFASEIDILVAQLTKLAEKTL